MKKAWILAALIAAAGLVSSASASTITTAAAHAGTITVNADGSITLVQPSATYDGSDDVVYNVINNSPVVVPGFTLQGADIADFDGDGINGYASPTGADLGHYQTVIVSPGVDPTDYSGWSNGLAADQNTFTGIILDVTPGIDQVTINFGGGLATGGTGFFSLEAETGAPAGLTITPSAPLPPALWGGLALVLGIAGYSRFAKTKIA